MHPGISSCLQKAEESGLGSTAKVLEIFLFASLCSINSVLPAESEGKCTQSITSYLQKITCEENICPSEVEPDPSEVF